MMIIIRKEASKQAMNRDEGSCQLSHTYDRCLNTTAGHRLKIQKNWVPAFFWCLRPLKRGWNVNVPSRWPELHMAVHHLHYHSLHLLLLAQCFILNSTYSRPGSSANPFLHRPFPLLLDWLHGLSDHVTFLICSTAALVSVLD